MAFNDLSSFRIDALECWAPDYNIIAILSAIGLVLPFTLRSVQRRWFVSLTAMWWPFLHGPDYGFRSKFGIHPRNRYVLERVCTQRFINGSGWGFTVPFPPPEPVAALYIKVFGSFGNHVICYVNAWYFAAIFGILQMFCEAGWAGFALGERFLTRDGIDLQIVSDQFHAPFPVSQLLVSEFFHSPPVCDDWSWKDALSGALDIFRKPFPPLSVDENTLIIVLRGGWAVWRPDGNSRMYMQAPCQYFLSLMRNHSRTIVIGGEGSPCVRLTIRAGGQWMPWDQVDGTRHMLYARYVAFTRTSRAHAIIALSPALKRFWMFDVENEKTILPVWWRGFKPNEFADGYDCVPSEQYRKALIPWFPTKEQLRIMVEGNCMFKPISP
jgi:hypothetical protein